MYPNIIELLSEHIFTPSIFSMEAVHESDVIRPVQP